MAGAALITREPADVGITGNYFAQYDTTNVFPAKWTPTDKQPLATWTHAKFMVLCPGVKFDYPTEDSCQRGEIERENMLAMMNKVDSMISNDNNT